MMSPKGVNYDMVDNSKDIRELKKLKKKLMKLDMLDDSSTFEFSLLFIDMLKTIDNLEIGKGKKHFMICSDEEAGIA